MISRLNTSVRVFQIIKRSRNFIRQTNIFNLTAVLEGSTVSQTSLFLFSLSVGEGQVQEEEEEEMMRRKIIVRKDEKQNKEPRMMTGRVFMEEDTKYRRVITAAIVSRRLIQEARTETTKYVGVLKLQ